MLTRPARHATLRDHKNNPIILNFIILCLKPIDSMYLVSLYFTPCRMIKTSVFNSEKKIHFKQFSQRRDDVR